MFAHIPRWLRVAVYIQLALVVAIPLGGWILQRASEAADRERFPPLGRMVEVGDHLVHIFCEGERGDGPVVVFNADISDHGLIWTHVLRRTATAARSCYIDRAGMGWSELGDKDRSITAIAKELYATLQAAGERGPYVLVGHGLGALQMLAVAGGHRNEAAGLVLVDPMPPVCLKERFAGIAANVDAAERPAIAKKLEEIVAERGPCPDGEGGTELLGWLARIGMIRALAGKNFDPTAPSPDLLEVHRALKLRTAFADATLLESQTAYVGMGQVREMLGLLRGLPAIVIAKGRMGNFAQDQEFLEKRGDPSTLAFERAQLGWLQEAQRNLAQSLDGTFTIAPKSAHYVMLSEPEVVAEAVREVVRRASGSGAAAQPVTTKPLQ